MRKFRGKTKDGKWVKGWYCQASDRHLIIQSNAQLVNPAGGLVIDPCPNYYINRYVEVIPETVEKFVCKDKNGKDVWFDDEVQFMSSKYKIAGGFKDWVWLYEKGLSTYYWKIVPSSDIALIEEKE